MKYQALLFDLDNTLMDFSKSEEDAIYNTFTKFDIEHSEENIKLYEAKNHYCWDQVEKGELKVKDLASLRFYLFLNELKIDRDHNLLAKDFIEELAKGTYLMPYALEVVKELSQKYKIAIVSNGISYIQNKRLDNSLLKPYIDKRYISEDLDVAKPDPLFFAYPIKEYGSNLLVIGDSYKSDVVGARNAGLDCIYYSKEKDKDVETIDDLRALLTML